MTLTFKTTDPTIKLVPGGFISEHFMYKANDGELCIIADEKDLKVDPEIGVQPIPEGVNT